MKVVFRVDASEIIGTGHMMRCLTLAASLRQLGATIYFICKEHNGHLCALIKEQGFRVVRLPLSTTEISIESLPAHAHWLGTSWQEDSKVTIAAIKEMDGAPDWLVIDHYAIDERWEKTLHSSVKRIFVIDDLADRAHHCDLLLDQNLIANRGTRYSNKVPDHCRLLLGPEYALLQPIYAKLRLRTPPKTGSIQRILIYFGGADNDNLTGLALAAFLKLNQVDIHVDVVINNASVHAANIHKQVKEHNNIRLYRHVPNLSTLMAQADLAIGASGATSWERLCLGLPTLVITLADNQIPIAKELHRLSLVQWLGHKDTINEDIIYKTLCKTIAGTTDDLSQHYKNVVDGDGVNRVSTALMTSEYTNLKARHADLLDEDILLKWANDATTNSNTLLKPIGKQKHLPHFIDQLRNLDTYRIYMIETEDSFPLAQVSFELSDQGWEIDCFFAPYLHQIKIKRQVLESALVKFCHDETSKLIFRQIDNAIIHSLYGEDQSTVNKKSWDISLCSDKSSWINMAIPELILEWLVAGHQVTWLHHADDLQPGDICFYISYGKIVGSNILSKYKNSLVVHESALPKGKGWSPLTWQVLENANSIPVTLFEAKESIDSGVIYLQEEIKLNGNELIEDLRQLQFQSTLNLCKNFVINYPDILNNSQSQLGESTYYQRRYPKDGKLDLDQSIRQQFNLLRISDNKRYPAWFEIEGKKFKLEVSRY